MKGTAFGRVVGAVAVGVAVAACGGDGAGMDGAAVQAAAASPAALTATELEQGLGPIRDLALAGVDEALAERGESAFQTKCYACHRLEERYVAPKLGDVLSRRSPEFVMNMMLNPAEMIERHPAVKALLAEYLTPMPNQNLTVEEARAILEYLREEVQEGYEDERRAGE